MDVFQGLFSPFEIESAVELTLGANADLDSVKRLMWNVQDMGTTNSGPCLALCHKFYAHNNNADMTALLANAMRLFSVRIRKCAM